ncbi:hypothetical protein IV498_10535 [Paenarthrobacter sp. Z7-10]|uniref:hypothetical protein n=1 Tax=Paenarthrobacter sp. Z7-10 TaxID=2787635 RepID=UPI0022A9CC4D|nr:hypothetical protein [Paenarthrobacter sp. Z7-10]MCZ2403607.1 hypothetical protein [Paenarthrobacter sp. Z7-10]
MDGWFVAGLVIGLISTGICVLAAALKKVPNDVTLLSVAAVELFLLVYLVGSLLRVGGGEQLAGEPWEFWAYLVTALALPIAGFYWALLERSFWSNYVLAAVGVTVIVMMARMAQIWYGHP